MLCIVIFSASATFAADINDTIVSDEITIDEPLAVDETPTVVADDNTTASEVVTKDNFNKYFTESGTLNTTVNATELIFKGEISDVGVNTIVLDRPISIVGENSTFTNVAIGVNSSDVVISGLTLNIDNNVAAIAVFNATNVLVENNEINFKAIKDLDVDGYAIIADSADVFNLINNSINYVGATNGLNINNGVRISNSQMVTIRGNKFNLSLVSAAVGWAEVPAGSGNWVSSPISEGIGLDSSSFVYFSENAIDMTYNDVMGDYDTIYVVDFKDSNNVTIEANNITALGHTYIYGIQMSANGFNITGNNIKVESDNYYANGIDIEGPAMGIVEDNTIDVKGVESAYAIYSGMNGADVKANYTANTISGEAYNVFGFSLGDVESNLENNTIDLAGNYTTGIAYYGVYMSANNNRLFLVSSEEGNQSVWEAFGVEAVGVKVTKGSATFANNTIVTPGKGASFTGNETYVYLGKNFINVVGNDDKDAYAIYASNLASLYVINNTIDYQGTTKGTGINNAIYLNNASDNSWIMSNNIILDLVSSYVPWIEIPTGSGNWVSFPVSEGIVVENTDGTILGSNNINVTYGDVVGTYDTIYTVSFKNSTNAQIELNNITAAGHTYIYGIQISGNDFNITENNIKVESDNYYANGIDIEGPATGVVENNVIDVKGNVSAYAIYSGMNGANVSAEYIGNNITGQAYNVFGFSLGDVESNLENNTIDLVGNYTTGIAYRGDTIYIIGNKLFLTSSEEGNETIWEGFGVEAVGIKAIKGEGILISNNTIVTPGKGVSITGNVSYAALSDNFINVVGNDDKDAYAVYSVNAGLLLSDNTIDYQGTTKGTGINNAIYVNNASNICWILSNDFILDLVSSYVPWAEVPTGSGNWVSSPISEGIVIEDTDKVRFRENNITVTYGDVVGDYDTIYTVSFKDSDNALIKENNITALGHTYIYGIQISGYDFNITDNNIKVESDNYYANGIDIEGPASGLVEGNVIEAKGVTSAYPIYSGMNGADVCANYTGNKIKGDAYLVIGMSLGDMESNIVANDISVEGNYTTGIAYRGAKLNVDCNVIYASASNVGNESVWEAFGVDTVGIKVVAGEATISLNEVYTTGNYTVDVRDTESSVYGNYLVSDILFGDESVNQSGNADVHDNLPIKTKAVISIIEVDGDCTVIGLLTDADGNIYANQTVNYSFNGTNATVVTGDDGTFKLENLSNGVINISYDGTRFVDPANATITLKDIAPVPPVKLVSMFDIPNRAITIKGKAVDTKANETPMTYTTTLMDENGKPIANVYIEFAVNNKIYNRTTFENGSFVPYRLNMIRAGRYTMAFNFAGNENYTNAFACVCVDLDKKPIKIKASDKSYKASTKTKKYTVTLSTSKAVDGKMYMSPRKVTLTVNGKTYTKSTNSNGKVTFKITNLKSKAKYKAKISYEGDKTYESATKTVTLTVK